MPLIGFTFELAAFESTNRKVVGRIIVPAGVTRRIKWISGSSDNSGAFNDQGGVQGMNVGFSENGHDSWAYPARPYADFARTTPMTEPPVSGYLDYKLVEPVDIIIAGASGSSGGSGKVTVAYEDE